MIDWSSVFAATVIASAIIILYLLQKMMIDRRADSIKQEHQEVLTELNKILSPSPEFDGSTGTYTVHALHHLLLDKIQTQEIDAENGHHYLNALRMISHTDMQIREARRIRWWPTIHGAHILKQAHKSVWRAKQMLGLQSPLINLSDEEPEYFEL